jgi:hypothetical protein
MGIRTDEGEELIIGPNQVFDLPPGHVTRVEGGRRVGDGRLGRRRWIRSAARWGSACDGHHPVHRHVDSTALARDAGDASWERTGAMHEDVVRSVLAGFGGREIETAGDSFLVVLDSAEGAIRCGLAPVGASAPSLPRRTAFVSAR